jgi:ATP-dependent protease HslVU (ClpYQ) peptidase subunit
MTTIAFRSGIIAADSRGGASGWVLPGFETKLLRLRHTTGVAAICGNLAEAMKLFDWLDDPLRGDKPQPGGNPRVIVVDQGGDRLTVYEDGHHYVEPPAPFYAWGSGFPVALGAMHAGASAEKAVEIAGLVDPHTGGPVNFIECRKL